MASFNVRENSTAKYTAVLKDENDVAVPAANLNTFILTLYNLADLAIINSRDDQNVLNANNVTVDSSGNVVWIMKQLDNPIIDDTLEYETHVGLFQFTYATGTKGGNHEVHFLVENLSLVP